MKDPVSGLSHLVGAVLAVLGAVFLILRAHGAGATATVAIYAACMIALYCASSLYHLIRASEDTTRALRLFDHIAIFLFIAGTATPVLFLGLQGKTRAIMLAAIWSLAALGIALKLLWRSAPRALYTAMYVGMGWSVVSVGRQLLAALPGSALWCALLGGVVYTIGAIIYATKRPNPHRHFGFHEIWHLCVLGGSGLHYAAIAIAV